MPEKRKGGISLRKYNRAAQRRWRAANPERLRAQQCKPQTRDAQRRRAAHYRGYSPAPLEKDCPPRPHDGRCESCQKSVGVDKLQLDHDHLTGVFLGWCCRRCNLLGEDIKQLMSRVAYLRKRGF
jgi:hypothetical protein